MDPATVERFEADRNRLASLAYRLLGSAADAEDAVQETFLRWQAADRSRITTPEAWLAKVVTNLALDQLRSAAARREHAAGERLPEPLLDGDPMLGPADTVEQRESVTLAVLLLLQRLPPMQRAVYVLREAFSYSHAEIAEMLDITESASQQHIHRARDRIAAGRHAHHVDRPAARRIVQAFVDAASSGSTERLVALLTDDATAITDGAGLARRPLRYSGPHRVATAVRAATALTPAKRRLVGGSPLIHAGIVNSGPAVIAAIDDRVVGVVVLDLRHEKIATVHGIAAPARLARLADRWRRHEHHDPLPWIS
jgi:RNA polymerase sigma factor (sigma-70 family)